MSTFNMNTNDLVILSNKLDRISRSELPLAIRGTLNQMAFDVKKVHLLNSAKVEFDYIRNESIFKVLSGVNKATGFNTKTMKSEAGIVNKSGMNEVAEGLKHQELGESINKKSSPRDETRISSNRSKKVSRPARLQNLDSIDARKKRKHRFIAAAIAAKKSKKTILIKGRDSDMVARVKSFKRSKSRVSIKLKWLYRIDSSGINIKLKKRSFIKKAAIRSGNDIDRVFKKQADIRINKALSK